MGYTPGLRSGTGKEIRLAWERFLSDSDTSAPLPADVREPVVASWRRSRMCGVAPDQLAIPYDEDTDTESRFRWAAEPVLESLAGRLAGTPNAILLADSQGRVVRRWVGDNSLLGRLDSDFVSERFCFGEEHVGTNGLGSPVEARRPFIVAGPEHYKDAFHHWTCVGAPVIHPVSRQLEGIIDISCLYKDTNDLILPLVVDAVHHVEERLFFDASNTEQTLLRHFLPAARGTTRAVTAVSDKTILTNPAAARLLSNVDQAMLWEHAARAVSERNLDFHELRLNEGQSVQVRCTPIHDGSKLVGALLEFRREVAPVAARKRRRTVPAPELEGLVGKSKVWQSLCAEALKRLDHGLPVLVTGEAGVGKLSLVLGLCAHSAPGVEPAVLECALEPVDGVSAWFGEARRSLFDDRPVVFRHLEALSAQGAAALSVAIDDAASNGHLQLFATLTSTAKPIAECMSLVERFAANPVEVPPLRQRQEDVPDLVDALLARHDTDHDGVRMRSEAMQLLIRGEWPQNVRQLENVVRAALANHSGQEIGIDDLPREVRRRGTRRQLSAMEQIELDAILAALERSGYNRTKAAATLGISRATLHRRLKAYGLDLDRSAF